MIVEALVEVHAGELATAGFGVAATIATFVTWAVQGTPPESDDRPIERSTPSEMFYDGKDRPAGPDAESGIPGLEADPNDF